MSTPPTVRLLSPDHDAHLVPYLAALHAACIHQDGMVASFVLPLDNDRLLAYWRDMLAEASAGKRLIVIVIQLDESESGLAAAKGAELKGVVMLHMPQSEMYAHQGHVEKVMVSPTFRQRGAAKTMMDFVETEALKNGRKLLLLSTEIGSPAERVYPRLGYVEYGRMPGYCIGPSGDLVGSVFYYKQLS